MKSIFTLKSKFVKHLKETKIDSENIARTLSKVINDCTHYKTTVHQNKYDNYYYTFVYDNEKCFCIEIEPLNYDKKIKETMIDIIELPYSKFIKNGEFIN